MGINSLKPDVLAQIIHMLTNFFNAWPGHDVDFNNALWVYVKMLNNYKNKQCVLHCKGENQLQARARNEAEERRPGQPQAADFHEEEDDERDGEGEGSKLKEQSDDERDGDKGLSSAKRPWIDESQFPWQSVREISQALLHPELQCTLELIENYTLDLKAIRQSLTNSPECSEFPEEQWLTLLAGKAINLDSVFAANHSTSINKVQSLSLALRTHSLSAIHVLPLQENHAPSPLSHVHPRSDYSKQS
ncbi:hypothetical protein ARMGADRAFT_1023269 [Armillaria gallica]|uniref:Uncharacterized protein n=1 Tax=Armillaria gallica TaxID=47427 RepID=A0A2H3EE85_ARMGA|nr:hypothetical protein ARMGADRAFT_1023269 [Armillaria gallica]